MTYWSSSRGFIDRPQPSTIGITGRTSTEQPHITECAGVTSHDRHVTLRARLIRVSPHYRGGGIVQRIVTRFNCLTLSVALGLFAGACTDDDEPKVVEAPRGKAGETCGSRSDCIAGLACLDNRCVDPDAGTPEADASVKPIVDTRGLPGESCTRATAAPATHASTTPASSKASCRRAWCRARAANAASRARHATTARTALPASTRSASIVTSASRWKPKSASVCSAKPTKSAARPSSLPPTALRWKPPAPAATCPRARSSMHNASAT